MANPTTGGDGCILFDRGFSCRRAPELNPDLFPPDLFSDEGGWHV